MTALFRMVAEKFLTDVCFGNLSVNSIYVALTETKFKLHHKKMDCKVYVIPNPAVIFEFYDLKVTQNEDLKILYQFYLKICFRKSHCA